MAEATLGQAWRLGRTGVCAPINGIVFPPAADRPASNIRVVARWNKSWRHSPARVPVVGARRRFHGDNNVWQLGRERDDLAG